MIGFGFVKDWKTLVGLRLILGILEVRNVIQRTLGIVTHNLSVTEWLFPRCRLSAQYLVQTL